MTSTELVEFNGQVVVISGAATGIGKASAQLIASRGAKVIALDFNKSALDELAKELKLAPNQVHTCDISDQNQITATITAILKDHGTIDALINTAGIVGPSNTPAIDVKWADFEKVLQVNLYGAIWLTQQIIPHMKKQAYGRIVHLASIAGKEGNPGLSPYNTSKAGMIGFVKGVAKEVAPDGIVINSLAPAVISTPMNANTSDETLKYMISRIPMGRVGQPEEVAEAYEALMQVSPRFTIAASFGNVHGVYKPGNVQLTPVILKNSQAHIQEKYNTEPNPVDFVFHGGSGSSLEEIREAIGYGVVKMNIDTDMQFAFTEGVRDYIETNLAYLRTQIGNPNGADEPNKKYYDPRKWLREGELTFVKRLEQSFADLNNINTLN